MELLYLKNKYFYLIILLIVGFVLISKTNFLYAQSNEVKKAQAEVISLSSLIRNNEIELVNLEDYEDTLQIKKLQNQKKLQESNKNITEAVLALYKINNAQVKSFFSAQNNSTDIALSYSLFNYYGMYFKDELIKANEYIKVINQNELEIAKAKKQIKILNDKLKSNQQKIREYYQKNSNIDTAKIYKENQQINKELSSLLQEMRTISITLLPQEKKQDEAFIKNKKQFILPVVGFLESGYRKLEKTNIYYTGIVVLASPNSVVMAPFDGEVVFSSNFNQFESLTIIKHSPSYFTIISGKYDSFVRPAQLVKKYEPIGSSISIITPIYTELNYKNQPINITDFISEADFLKKINK